MMRLHKGIVFIVFACLLLPAMAWCEIITVFAPSHAGISQKAVPTEQIQEVDILMALMDPSDHTGVEMDRPQLFALLRYPPTGDPIRQDLLGDVEEIRYLDTRAWGANVGVEEPGLYQFLLEDKPRWDDQKKIYVRQQAKVIMPVLDAPDTWSTPVGQGLEIVPLSRPYGQFAPALFTGRLLQDGKAVADVTISAGNVSTAEISYPSEWHRTIAAKTDKEGNFSLILNRPGWWFIEGAIPGEPLKGPDGNLKETWVSTVFWLYADGLDKTVEAAGR